MTKPFSSLDDKLAMQPLAHYATEEPLWAWAAEQAAAAKALDEKIRVAREVHEATERVLRDSLEYRELDAAKERLKDARKAAVETDPAVIKASDAAKAARKELRRTAKSLVVAEKAAKGNVKALVDVKAETERGIVSAIKAGRVPAAVPHA